MRLSAVIVFLVIRHSKASQRAVCPFPALGIGLDKKNISSSVLSPHLYRGLHPNDIFIPGDMA